MNHRLLALALLAPAPAMAAAATPGPLLVTTEMLVERRIAAADGTTRIALAKPDRVVPGERVTLVLAYRNVSRQPLADVVLANPVPKTMQFSAVGAGGPPAELSVDGVRFGALATLRAGPRAATPADVRAVRWRLDQPVAPGASGRLSFQAVLK